MENTPVYMVKLWDKYGDIDCEFYHSYGKARERALEKLRKDFSGEPLDAYNDETEKFDNWEDLLNYWRDTFNGAD